MAFIEVFQIPETGNYNSPLDAWAGFDGTGFDNRMFLTLGGRRTGGAVPNHGGAIFSHDDALGDSNWVNEYEAANLETIGKIRDWTNQFTGIRRMYAWCETPSGGQSPLISRGIGSASWTFEPIAYTPSVVGGRGIGVNYWQSAQGILYEGHTDQASVGRGRLWVMTPTSGIWNGPVSTLQPTNIRELEFEPPGILWEFYNDSASGYVAFTFRGGVAIANPPGAGGDGCNGANWFPTTGHMYVAARGGASNIYRYISSTNTWETVLNVANRADHILYIPRVPGELWALGKNPFQAWRSTNGVTWTLEFSTTYGMSLDTNQLTAIALYNGRIWLMAEDNDAGLIRIYREDIQPTFATTAAQII
jgi:hypothetical protein